MAGQIIKKSDRRWLVRWFLGRDSDTGKKRYASKTVRGTKRDAQQFLNADHPVPRATPRAVPRLGPAARPPGRHETVGRVCGGLGKAARVDRRDNTVTT